MDLSELHQVLHWAKEGRSADLEKLFNESVQRKSIGASIDVSDLRHPRVFIKKVEPIHRGGIGGDAVNGGIISMLIDLAVGLLGLPYFDEGSTATHHISIHFVKPLYATSVRLEAEETEIIHNRVFGNVRVLNERGEVCAFASGILVKGIRKVN